MSTTPPTTKKETAEITPRKRVRRSTKATDAVATTGMEAPHKLKNTLADMYKAWGDRNITLSREITKLHEETLRFTLSEAIAYFKEKR